MIIITIAISLFLAYIKVVDLMKHRKVMKSVSDKDVLVDTVKRKGQRVMFFMFIGATLVFVVILIFYSALLASFNENLAYVFVFLILSFSEWCNFKTIENIHVFEKTVVFSTFEIRIKSIRSILPSGKKNSNVMMLDGTSSFVPNEVAAKLTALQKARKAK